MKPASLEPAANQSGLKKKTSQQATAVEKQMRQLKSTVPQ